MTPRFLQLRAAAAYVGLSPVTLRRAVARGELVARKTSDGRTHRLLFQPDDLVRWVERTCPPVESVADVAEQLVADVLVTRPTNGRRSKM